MYVAKDDFILEIRKLKMKDVAERIGITKQFLSKVVNKNPFSTKIVAYCLTKYIDNNKEINDFFERIERG